MEQNNTLYCCKDARDNISKGKNNSSVYAHLDSTITYQRFLGVSFDPLKKIPKIKRKKTKYNNKNPGGTDLFQKYERGSRSLSLTQSVSPKQGQMWSLGFLSLAFSLQGLQTDSPPF